IPISRWTACNWSLLVFSAVDLFPSSARGISPILSCQPCNNDFDSNDLGVRGDDMMRRIVILPLLFLSIVIGCGRSGTSSETNAADAGQPVQGDWAVVRFESEPDNLNPLITQLGTARYVLNGVNNST